MADTVGAAEPVHVFLAEDVTHQAVALAKIEVIALARHDAGGILPPMLQHGECIVQVIAHIGPANHTDYATHIVLSTSPG